MKTDITLETWLGEQEAGVKGSSLKTYKSYERVHIRPFLGHLYLAEITAKKQRAFKKQLCESLADKTVRDFLSYLRTLLKRAKQKGYTVCIKTPKTAVEWREKEVPDFQEHKALSEKLRHSQKPVDMGILLAMSTGLRLGEVLGLRVKDVDLRASVLHVRANRQRIYDPKTNTYPVREQTPKTQKSCRSIPLHPALKNALAHYLKNMGNPDKEKPLIANRQGKAYDARTLQRRFQAVKKELGLRPGVTFHSLRHSFATRALELGASIHTLSELLGHSSVAFTLNTYGHSVTEQKRLEMEKIAKCF